MFEPTRSQDPAAQRRRNRGKAVVHAIVALPQAVLLGLGMLLIPLLPRRCELAFGHFIGRVMTVFRSRSYRYARANLDIVYRDTKSDAEKHALAKASLEHLGQVLMDYFWFSRHVKARVAKYCSFADETTRRWGTTQFPGLFVSAHIGNWELGGLLIASQGRAMSSVFRPIGVGAATRMLARFRKGEGQGIIPREGAMRGILKAFREKGVVALLLDQHTDTFDGGEYVDFLGLPATVSGAVGTLSHRMKTPVLITGMFYDAATDRYSLRTIREISAEETAAMDPHDLTRAIAEGVCTMILEYPGQWLWSYRRWKRYRYGDDPARYPFYARLDPSTVPVGTVVDGKVSDGRNLV